MKIIINNILPPKGFKCINLFGILFCRRIPNKIDINHETIHTKLAYKNISFEREAYQNQDDLDYLSNRKHYSWFSYIKKI